MSRQAKTGLGIAAAIIGLLVGILTLSQTVWASGGEYAVLESKVQRLERDRELDRRKLERIDRTTTRLCAVTPGCE